MIFRLHLKWLLIDRTCFGQPCFGLVDTKSDNHQNRGEYANIASLTQPAFGRITRVLTIIGVFPQLHLNLDLELDGHDDAVLDHKLYSRLAAAATPLAPTIPAAVITLHISPWFPKRRNHCRLVKIAGRGFIKRGSHRSHMRRASTAAPPNYLSPSITCK